jgi:ABC-2 type transport system ATP-binding protein
MRISDKILEVALPKEVGLNFLFSQLSALNIKVISLKNKTNRLEQLFMDLVESKPQGG